MSAPWLPEAGAVLEPRAEDELEELGRQLVVLLVRPLDLLGDRRRAQALDELAGRIQVLPSLARQPSREVRADPEAEERIRDAPGLDQAVDERGSHGMKTLVSRW